MIVRADTATSFLIEFTYGHPDGVVSWKLRGPDQAVITTGSVVIPVGAVSTYLRVPAEFNDLAPDQLSTFRDVEWTYDVNGAVVNGEARYIVEGRVPFGASADGVRTKLGIDDPADLPDNEISLVNAYLDFREVVGDEALSETSPSNIAVRNAIEASAALDLLPTLMVRLAKKEDSGTSAFQRMDVDWAVLGASLESIILAGYVDVVPTYDDTMGFGSLFLLASPETDAITGA